MGSVVDRGRRWFRLLAVSDPGGLRLRSAASTALSAAGAMTILIAVSSGDGSDVSAALLGTVVAVQASAAVKDPTQRGRVVTTLLVPVPAVAAVGFAAWLDQYGVAAAVVFIAVLFGAVWVRRWGPRGNALGMVAFICYFFTLFLHPDEDQLPGLFAAIGIGVGATLAVRTVLLPERPRLEIRRLARALRGACVEVLAAADPRYGDVGRLRRRLDTLGTTALVIEDWIDRHAGSDLVTVTGKRLSSLVFEAQIATEQVARAVWRMPGGVASGSGSEQAVRALRIVLRDYATDESLEEAAELAAAASRRPDLAGFDRTATMSAWRAVHAHISIHRVSTRTPSLRPRVPATLGSQGPVRFAAFRFRRDGYRTGSAAAATDVDPTELDETRRLPGHTEPDRYVRHRSWIGDRAARWQPSSRAAVQVAVATSVATLLGAAVSPERWYWAVLTAFVVFNGASTRGEILSRAGHRVVGTVAGVAAGVALAAVVGDRPPIQLALIVVCIFVGFYFAPIAYGILTFCVTVVLAMLYGLLGMFGVDVLGLRVAETAVGAVVGLASAYFIFATSTRGELEAKAVMYLDTLDEVLVDAIEAVIAPGVRREALVGKTRALDTRLQDVLTAARPLRGGPATRSRRAVRRLTRVLTVTNRSLHQLARAGVMATRADPDTAPSEETAEELRAARERVSATVDVLRRGLLEDSAERVERSPQTSILDVLLTAEDTPGALRLAVRSLSAVERAVFEAVS